MNKKKTNLENLTGDENSPGKKSEEQKNQGKVRDWK